MAKSLSRSTVSRVATRIFPTSRAASPF
ncbi:BnaCnng32790D [Brassica napus]|uniref:BnaCnng32790D protein n=1 Tax=Brassica napus TaxID=3708 RepID=A0A078J358_BRANA|nr:BnaCnng32790D [Brassica napus]